jgi:hypothetical protein
MGMNRRILTTSIALVVAMSATLAATAGAADWSTPTYPLGPGGLANLAVNAKGDIAIADSNFATSNATLAFRPAGGTFEPAVELGSGPTYDVHTALNANGDVALAWMTATSMHFAVRPSGGTFGPVTDVNNASLSSSDGVKIALDDSGDIILAYSATSGANTILRYAVYGADGTVKTSGSSAGGQNIGSYFDLAADGAGNTVIVWTRSDGTNTLPQATARKAGGTFAAPVDLAPGINAGDVAADMDEQGHAAVVWSYYSGGSFIQAAYHTAGGLFTAATAVTAPSTNGSYPEVAVSESGNVLVSWTGTGGLATARFGTFGQPFTGPTAQFATGSGKPSAAVAPDGSSAVIWTGAPSSSPGWTLHAAAGTPGGGFSETSPITGDVPISYINSSATPVAMNQDGDTVAGFFGPGSKVGVSVRDVTAPELRSLSAPTVTTAGTAAAFSVVPFDTFSTVTTSWDFGDGSGATGGASVSHMFGAAGGYDVKVTATDSAGNATSATRHITVAAAAGAPTPLPQTLPGPPLKAPAPASCKVPSLKNLTITRAKSKLTRGHCTLGKVTTPRKLKGKKGLVIRSQSRKAGASTANGAKVNVTLGTKPKPKKKKARGR